MRINQIQQQVNNRQQQSFTGVGDAAVAALRFLDTNQAWGATAVDFTCMVAPRTLTDFTRGADAGVETLRREASGTVNHAAVGLVYGPLAGLLMSAAVNSKYGIKAQHIFADSDVIDILGKLRFDTLKDNSGNQINEYVSRVADCLTTKNGQMLSSDAKKEFVKVFADNIQNPTKESKAMLNNIVLSDLGEEAQLVFSNGKRTVNASLGDIVDNISSFSKTLFGDKVVNSFKEVLADGAKDFKDVKFIKDMKNFGMRRSVLGLGIAAAIGCCIQPFNIYLTKKKTGSDGFVGVEGRSKDNSAGFKAMKAGVAAAFGAGVMALIGHPKDLLKNIQYKGMTPTLNQFKLVYGLTIMSRFMAARDKDELREATVKDTLGFLSWLVFGNFVSRGTLKALDKNLVGKTRDEVLYAGLKKAGIPTVKDGKALSFKQLLAKLPKADKATRKSLRYLNIAQLAGYAFSGIVLGIGIPKLNIYMTKKSEQKRAHQHVMSAENNMFRPENIAFLNKQMNFTSTKMLGK